MKEGVPLFHYRMVAQVTPATSVGGRHPAFLLGATTELAKTSVGLGRHRGVNRDDVLIIGLKDGLPQWRRTIALVGTRAFAYDLITCNQQVALSVAVLETSAALVKALRGSGWRVGAINGEQPGEANEAVRLAFQGGRLDAVAFTVTESISLHQHELPDGERTRALILHDMRHSVIQLEQIEGRCHRDGQRATVYYVFVEDTVEEAITATAVRRMVTMDAMAGEDASLLDAIAAIVEQAVTGGK